MHLRDWRRMKETTIRQRLRDLRRLEAHPVMPVKLHGTRYELVDTFYAYMKYRETVESKAATAVRNDFKAALAVGDYLQVPRDVWPRAPTVPRRAKKVLRSPEEIHQLLHAEYVDKNPTRSYENHLVKYLLAFDFGIGVRFPSEAFALRVQDFDPKAHTLIVTEPKKGSPTRRVLIEPTWLCCGRSRASLAYYLQWRAKVDVGGTDAFFLKPNGEPFPTKEALKAWLDQRVKPKFPWFHDYMGRTWCANARLVEWKFDYARVADWMGHDSVDTTRENYEAEARLYAKRYGSGWLERAFKGPRCSTTTPQTGGTGTFPSC